MSTIDLDAYFARIGYTGDRSATLNTLRAIHLHHAQTIAFENLTPLLRQPVALDLASLQQKLVQQRRGGYCFEQNLLLRAILLALGFRVTGLAARVLWNAPAAALPPRGHMLLLVTLAEGEYIADVGFGGMTLTAPLQLTPDQVQPTPHEAFRLLLAADEKETYILQVQLGEHWQSIYRFDRQIQQPTDYEVTNWYLANHPHSHFVNALIVARPTTGRRYALHNNQLTIHHLHSASEKHLLTSVAALRATLENEFGLRLPDTSALESTLQRLIS